MLGVLEGRMADPASHTDPEASAALAAGACCPASGNREADAALGRTDDSGRSVHRSKQKMLNAMTDEEYMQLALPGSRAAP